MGRLTVVLVAALALGLGAAGPAAASEPPRYRTTVQATDDTEFTLRSGEVGDRCSGWSKIEGTIRTTIKPAGQGAMVVFDPPGPVGTVLSHSLLRSKVTTRLRTTGTEHTGFPCGCGPSSELGECPPPVPDTKLNGNCGRSGDKGGSLGLVLRRGRLLALAGAPVERLLEDCPLATPDLMPSDVSLPPDLRLPASALRAIRRLKPGASTEVDETFKHAGRKLGCPRRTADLPQSVCSVLRFTMTVERVR